MKPSISNVPLVAPAVRGLLEAQSRRVREVSSGQRQVKHPFNKSIMRDGFIVILDKNGRERERINVEKVTQEKKKK